MSAKPVKVDPEKAVDEIIDALPKEERGAATRALIRRLAARKGHATFAMVAEGLYGPSGAYVHESSNYIRERIRASARFAVHQARVEEAIEHDGIRGRFREILVEALLEPWLPPSAGIGTGMIVNHERQVRTKTQEDLIAYDRAIGPSAFASSKTGEGVFTFNSILCRIEVKSTLRKVDIDESVRAAREVSAMNFTNTGASGATTWPKPLSLLFAFQSSWANDDTLLSNFANSLGTDPVPVVQCLCIPHHGCWFFDGKWKRAVVREHLDEVVLFAALISNSCATIHHARYIGKYIKEDGTSLQPLSLVGGIGPYAFKNTDFEEFELPRTA